METPPTEPAADLPPEPASGPPVAEVVARYRGRTLDVQHVRWSESPALGPGGWIFGGALLLLAGLALGLRGVSQAAAAAAACTEAPCPGPGGLTATLALACIGLGLVPLVLGLIRLRERPRTRYVLGEGPDIDLPVALSGDGEREAFPLVIALEQGLVLGLPAGARGHVEGGAAPIDLAEQIGLGRRSLALPAGGRAALTLGELELEVRTVPPAVLPRARRELDRLAWLSHAGAALTLGALFLSRGTAELDDLEIVEAERFERVARFLEEIPQAPRPETSRPEPPRERRPVERSEPRPRAPEPPPEIPLEHLHELDPTRQVVPTGARVSPSVRRQGSKGRAWSYFDDTRGEGILGQGDFVEAVESVAEQGRAAHRFYQATPEDDARWAALTSGPINSARHFGGLELSETERGGGVHSDKPKPPPPPAKMIAVDALAPPPPPSAADKAYAKRQPSVIFDPPSFGPDPGMDPVRLYKEIRARVGGLRRCYDDALADDPTLAGTMLLRIKFNDRGAVTQTWADWTTGGIARIEKCVLAEVKRWKIPTAEPRPTSATTQVGFSVTHRP